MMNYYLVIYMLNNGTEYWDRHALANMVDPNQIASKVIRARGYKTFFMLNESAEHENFTNVKMPTIQLSMKN